ncbi:hypothetical protein [Lactiplantibacillus mudanjiangensis]|uniref:Uncharacterized protein n=1 Tax=Lactiplantibacillus mudanjiangensis TaxID=1296538 RepID=A0A660DXG1_9LACO|nr:hypothetical protein [Lactiplantibacillus mudanjiangensis]VDG25732.1 hypothetical protein [Lactobacillus plantarum] [Lactiplantibacillus mudanjiangensis]VDG27907.1 hypothetical protein [Lactobacillus plantarum] [Lactiplantibacillus mudanjiangensis]
MKLSITPKANSNNHPKSSSIVPLGYDFSINGIPLDQVDLKITELNLKMVAGEKPELIIHTTADPINIEDFFVDVNYPHSASRKRGATE